MLQFRASNNDFVFCISWRQLFCHLTHYECCGLFYVLCCLFFYCCVRLVLSGTVIASLGKRGWLLCLSFYTSRIRSMGVGKEGYCFWVCDSEIPPFRDSIIPTLFENELIEIDQPLHMYWRWQDLNSNCYDQFRCCTPQLRPLVLVSFVSKRINGIWSNFAYALTLASSRLGLLCVHFRKFKTELWPLIINIINILRMKRWN